VTTSTAIKIAALVVCLAVITFSFVFLLEARLSPAGQEIMHDLGRILLFMGISLAVFAARKRNPGKPVI
jgi:hypothetical protein